MLHGTQAVISYVTCKQHKEINPTLCSIKRSLIGCAYFHVLSFHSSCNFKKIEISLLVLQFKLEFYINQKENGAIVLRLRAKLTSLAGSGVRWAKLLTQIIHTFLFNGTVRAFCRLKCCSGTECCNSSLILAKYY
jgi:hypothetical protein